MNVQFLIVTKLRFLIHSQLQFFVDYDWFESTVIVSNAKIEIFWVMTPWKLRNFDFFPNGHPVNSKIHHEMIASMNTHKKKGKR